MAATATISVSAVCAWHQAATIVQGSYRDARSAAMKLAKPLEPVIAGRRETKHPFIILQTGEQPDDPFFDRGRVIVTIYDQLLSGLL